MSDSCHFFDRHEWGKWEQYKKEVQLYDKKTGKIIGESEELHQRRFCKKCNKIQDKRVRSYDD